jgi:RND family efflux transporter MFP subunit
LRVLSVVCVAALCLASGCKEEAAPPPLTRVKAVTAELSDFAPLMTFTGVVAARYQTDLSFRLNGKISERLANPGDHVTADQVLARIDPVEQEAEVASAKAGVQSAQALLKQSTAAFERSKDLLKTGNTTRRDYDQAEANLRSAQAQLEQATAQLKTANDQLGFTVMRAGANGTITKLSAEAGQVVAQAQPVYTLALDGERDAVVNVNEWLLVNADPDKPITVSLVSDPKVTAKATVREIAPAVNAATMSVTVQLTLIDPPPTMSLGALVNATGSMHSRKVFLLPWGAVFERDGQPAVWTIDPRSNTVALQSVKVDQYTRAAIAVTGELQSGQTLVSAGGQFLRPGQKVEIAKEARP